MTPPDEILGQINSSFPIIYSKQQQKKTQNCIHKLTEKIDCRFEKVYGKLEMKMYNFSVKSCFSEFMSGYCLHQTPTVQANKKLFE